MIKQIYETIEKAETALEPLFNHDILTGFSGKKLMYALQAISRCYAQKTDYCYLEIGVFQGLTLLSTAGANPNFACFGIDNFKAHDPEKKNLSITQQRIAALNISNATLINEDYEEALMHLDQYIGRRKIGIFFIDGPHDYRSQLMCLLLAKPYLADDAVILVDDSNYQHVRQANRDFLQTHPDFKLIFEAYTPAHPDNMTAEQIQTARAGWWDGINIIVRDAENTLEQILPPQQRDRLFFENDHIVHASMSAPATKNLLNFMNLLMKGNYLRALKNLAQAKKVFQNKKCDQLFNDTNTYSDKLTAKNFAKWR